MANKERGLLSRKVDQICSAIFLTEDGKPKSALLIYSFSLALVFVVVFLASYMLLLEPLENAFQARSVFVRNVVEYTVPAIVGCIPCLALSFAFRERKNMVAASFTWLDVIVLIMFVTMAFMADKSDWATEYRLFLTIIGLPMLISAVLGTVGSQVIYRKRRSSDALRMEKYSSRTRY